MVILLYIFTTLEDRSDAKLAIAYYDRKSVKCEKKAQKHILNGEPNLGRYYECKAGMCRNEAAQIRAKLAQEEVSSGEVVVIATPLFKLKTCLYLDLLYKGLIKPVKLN